MGFAQAKFQAVMIGSEEQRVEALRQLLDYPVKEKDSEGSRFWYLRPGSDELEAENTCPIAVGFFKELNQGAKREIEQWLTEDDQDKQIRGHYTGRIATEQPVMYILLPEGNSQGNVALVLPTESRLRQRSIQVFDWTAKDLQARLHRLSWESLAQKVTEKITGFVPQVDWIFFKPAATAKELAQLLAAVARRIEQAMPDVYEAEGEDGYLHNLLKSFRKELIANLKLKADNDKDYSFADIYAQTIAYGLFTARVFSFVKNPKADFSRDGAWSQLPETNPFLRQLFKDISEQSPENLGDELVDAIGEAIAILRAAEMDAILADFRSKMNREDIVIRFYEDFLAAYKPTMRERRGVYYTPEPVVSYMVRSVDELIKDKFDKPLGIADPEVMILDPACGTGTFLLWIFKLIHERHQANPEAFEYSDWNDYVDHCLLPRIFGFELLMAPYAICHLKLGLFLEESGYRFESGQRLGVYLTNSLDDSISKSEFLFDEFIANESSEAAEIKKTKPISVVLGNPPYSAKSANLGEKVRKIVEPYRYVDGEKIIEKSALQFEKNIQEDYVKFFAFSQKIIGKLHNAILAFITNNSFLDSITLRGLRSSLLDEFNSIKILDLHGDTDKRELDLKGDPDKNVFDIKQGVAISIMIKNSKSQLKTKVDLECYDILGTRIEKYNFLESKSISQIKWKKIKYIKPKYFFKLLDERLFDEYSKISYIKDIFKVNSTGFESGKDEILTDFLKESLENKIIFFVQKSIQEVTDKFNIVSGWGLELVEKRNLIVENNNFQSKFIDFLFTPFDIRKTFYQKNLLKTNSFSAGKHLIYGKNISLLVMRQVSIHGEFTHVFASQIIPNNRAFYSKKGKISYFPLYLYPDPNRPSELQEEKRPNFSLNFPKIIESKLSYLPTPEAIFYYIYGIFYSPTYRTRYAEFLKIDFPRVPLTSDDRLFRQLADYGEQLVGLHLMTSPTLDKVITEFTEIGDRTVAPGHPKYSDGKVNINKQGDGFVGVPEEVWNFYVGGYQVCQKWLKDRKGRVLSDEDILHYQKIVVALQETIKLMQLIDEAIPSWPIE
ncbi:type ISP restriction/modification enzyme [Synechocystis sp. PCC 6714]|uniref:type ISP restriction/modification enzyme n=1 Tax=Synechocystis sp. (strain PCC 6714) TaxID=1147 RepID=UPI00040023CD|nr:type ISP restriction/modification enzyme [Synechocystis sp. PCC 6714]AIE76082.1 adenine specific DNA methyltransferase [Synechocystis sp. PCC 6714]